MSGKNTQKYRHLLEDAHQHIVHYCTQYLTSDDVLSSNYARPMLRYALDVGLGAHITSIIHEADSVLSCLEDLPGQICARHPWNDRVALFSPWQIWLANPQSICDTLIRFGPDWMVHRHLRKHPEHWNHVLQYAILEGNTPLANVVLSLGRNVNLPITIDSETTSPVKFALRHSPQKLIECFLSSGACLPVDAIHTVLDERQDLDPDILSLLIQYGANVHATHAHFKDSPLYTLLRKDAQSEESYLKAARVLVGAGCVFNSQDPAGIPSNLLHALIGSTDARRDCLDIVGVFIDAGWALDAADAAGKTPLHLAIEQQSSSFIEYLIERGARIPPDAIHVALQSTPINLDIVSVLVRHGADIDVMQSGVSPLHDLLARQNFGGDILEAVFILIEAGCSLDTMDKNGNVPLHLAIRRQSHSLVEYLIRRGACIPEDAIHLAVQPTHDSEFGLNPDVTSTLIFHGADVNALRCGANPLHTLLQGLHIGDCLAIARILIDAGCEYNYRNSAGYTPLCLAIIHEVPSVTKYLLLKGASLHIDSIVIVIKDSNTDVGLDIIRDLLQHVADADVFSQLLTLLDHRPLSQLSHDKNCLNIARVLVDARCTHDAVDSAKYSPLIDLAITQSLPRITQYFLQLGIPIHINHPVNVALNCDAPAPFINPYVRPEEPWVEQLLAWQTDCRFQTMRALVEAGHSANSRDSAGQTPLGIAIQKRIPSAVNYILGKLACGQLDSFCGEGLEEHNMVVIEALLLRRNTPLHELIRNVFIGPVSTYNLRFSSNGMHGPFCERDCGEMLLILIDEGFSVNDTDYLGDTPLCLAIRRQLFLVVEYLLRRDPIIDVDSVITAFDNQSHVWKHLLQKYMLNVDPLHTLISRMEFGHTGVDTYLAITKALIHAGCDVNAQNDSGITPLQHMCRLEVHLRYPAIRDLLYEEGALDVGTYESHSGLATSMEGKTT